MPIQEFIGISQLRGHGHVTNSAVISISYPCKTIDSPSFAPGILDFPSNSGLISNEHYCMVDVTVTIIKYAARIELKAIASNTYGNWPILKLFNKSRTATRLHILEKRYFEVTSLKFAWSCQTVCCWGIWIAIVSCNTTDLHVSEWTL